MTETNASNSPPRSVMMSIGDIAKRDQVSKPTVSIRVKRYVEKHGLAVERDLPGRFHLVNVAEYDHLRSRHDDPSKAQAPQARGVAPHTVPASETYDEALRQKTWHEAEKRRLELEEIKGGLVRRDRVEEAFGRLGDAVAQIIDRLPMRADELADAVAKGGTHGLRTALKAAAIAQRTEIAAALRALAAEAARSAADQDAPEAVP